jgi:hypothetical protein
MAKERNTFSRSRLFNPSYVRRLTTESTPASEQTAAALSGSQITSGSFRFDPMGVGLKSTQQIPIDWSLFENHTFFDSAESKVNVAFDTIVNNFPFDGTKLELDGFFDELSGFEKYVYDLFPKRTGYMYFSGTHNDNVGLGSTLHNTASINSDGDGLGTWIKVSDTAGALFPAISRDRSGKVILDPKRSDMSFEMQLLVPEQANDNQVIIQKINGTTHGITLALSESSNTTYCDMIMMVSSGSSHVSASMPVPKGEFHHVYASLNRGSGNHKINLYLNGALTSSSNANYNFGEFDFRNSPLTVGTGSVHSGEWSWGGVGSNFTPQVTLSGAMDELRVWHTSHKSEEINRNMLKGVFSQNALRLYFKFNEPITGSDVSNVDNVVIDSSGNSLHSSVTNFTSCAGANSDLHRGPIRDIVSNLLISGTVTSPMTWENSGFCPILFPDNFDVQVLNVTLMNSSSLYDHNNPNMITKLIPKHYLLEASSDEGFTEELGNTFDKYSHVSDYALPGLGDIPSPQIITSLLFTWAKYFDELKLFIDHFSNLLWVDYDTNDTIADQFVPFLADYYGFDLPNLFSGASLDQLIEGGNLSIDPSLATHSLHYVQNQLWRRVLINFNDIIRSKGTVYGIKALIRAMGIRSDSAFRFREYGGSSTRELKDIRKSRTEVSTFLDFSGSNADVTDTLSPQGVSDSKPFLVSPFLSGGRVEPGVPYPAGNNRTLSVHPVTGTNNPGDGLFTSGSWTYEAHYKFEGQQTVHATTQSLARLHSTGSWVYNDGGQFIHANLVGFAANVATGVTGSLTLYVAPDSGYNHGKLLLTGVNVLDGNQWHVSFGCERPDGIVSSVSSSYFLRATRQNFGSIVETHRASMYHSPLNPNGATIDRDVSSIYNASGTFVTIGSQSLATHILAHGLQNADPTRGHDPSTEYGRLPMTTHFDGRVGHIRFWSKALTEREDLEHALNFKSVGVFDPLTNFNFVTTKSGSFEKLRLDVSTDQLVTESNSDGGIELFDFTQAKTPDETGTLFYMTGSGFEPSKRVIKPERFDYSILDPKFDEASVDNKIRIRSFQNYDNILALGGEVAPVYEVRRSEEPVDDARFSIDVSSIQALNEDMINIFSTLDALDNALGNPELLFATEYPDLQRLREVYFNRLTDKVRMKAFFEFFKWFDTAVGSIIETLVPRKTKFLGVNFVIESHMLERSKFNYLHSDIYLGENDRRGLHGQILLQQLVAKIRKM